MLLAAKLKFISHSRFTTMFKRWVGGVVVVVVVVRGVGSNPCLKNVLQGVPKKTGHLLTFLGNLGTERPKVPQMAKKVPRIAKPKKIYL